MTEPSDLPQRDHLIRPGQHARPVCHHEHRGDSGIGEEALPQAGLGLDVECARQIIDHEQLGPADERSGSRRPLDLTA